MIAEVLTGKAQVAVGFCVVRFQGDGTFKACDCLIVPARAEQCQALIEMRHRVSRICSDGTTGRVQRFGVSSRAHMQETEQ